MPTATQAQTKTRMSFMTDKKEAVNRLAQYSDRSSSYIINKAIDEYIKVQNWQVKHIEKAVAAADRGEFVKGDWREAMDDTIAGK